MLAPYIVDAPLRFPVRRVPRITSLTRRKIGCRTYCRRSRYAFQFDPRHSSRKFLQRRGHASAKSSMRR
jgi:hypothetical protein